MLYAGIAMLLFIIFPSDTVAGAMNGLRLCASAVIPSLFPFFVVTRILTASLPNFSFRCRLFGIDPKFLPPLLISFLGGYPVGVSTVTAMYENGKLEKKEAEQALTFCNNSGPGFFVGMIGTIILGSAKKGLLLYLIHICSALLCAVIIKKDSATCTIKRIKTAPICFSQTFINAISASCEAILQVSAMVIFFSVLSAILRALGIFRYLPSDAEALICGILELTSGTAKLQGSSNAFVLCAFLMGWGGICIHMQAMCLWQKVGLKPKFYLASKLLHGLFSAFFALVLLSKSLLLIIASAVLFIICMIFPLIRQKRGRKTEKVVV